MMAATVMTFGAHPEERALDHGVDQLLPRDPTPFRKRAAFTPLVGLVQEHENDHRGLDATPATAMKPTPTDGPGGTGARSRR